MNIIKFQTDVNMPLSPILDRVLEKVCFRGRRNKIKYQKKKM